MLSMDKVLVVWTIILLATLSIAVPETENQTSSLIFQRAEPKAVSCGRNLQDGQAKYSKKAVQAAFDELQLQMNKEETDKPQSTYGSRYPAKFYVNTSGMRSVPVMHKLRKITHCEPGQDGTTYLEFPLTTEKFTGGDAGVDRVLAVVYGKRLQYRDALYCLAMTHRDAPRNDHTPADTDDEAEECK